MKALFRPGVELPPGGVGGQGQTCSEVVRSPAGAGAFDGDLMGRHGFDASIGECHRDDDDVGGVADRRNDASGALLYHWLE
jgi:hypothetical protein